MSKQSDEFLKQCRQMISYTKKVEKENMKLKEELTKVYNTLVQVMDEEKPRIPINTNIWDIPYGTRVQRLICKIILMNKPELKDNWRALTLKDFDGIPFRELFYQGIRDFNMKFGRITFEQLEEVCIRAGIAVK